MKYLKLIAKGAVVGIGMIIPGVSGGTLAVLLGIYDELILRISSLRKDPHISCPKVCISHFP